MTDCIEDRNMPVGMAPFKTAYFATFNENQHYIEVAERQAGTQIVCRTR